MGAEAGIDPLSVLVYQLRSTESKRAGRPMRADAMFPSRVDTWLAMLVLGSLALAVYQAWALYATAPQESLLAAGIALGVFVLVLALTWPCTYTLTDTHLVVRAGIVRHRIAYRDISGVQPSRSLWAGPALSLRRVKVTYAGRFVLISPRERPRFIEELQRRVAQSRESGASLHG